MCVCFDLLKVGLAEFNPSVRFGLLRDPEILAAASRLQLALAASRPMFDSNASSISSFKVLSPNLDAQIAAGGGALRLFLLDAEGLSSPRMRNRLRFFGSGQRQPVKSKATT